MPEETSQEIKKSNSFWCDISKKYYYCFAVILLLLITLVYSWSAPRDFPSNSVYNLKSGETLSSLAINFSEKNIIKSEFWFKSFVYIFSLGNAKIISGNYALDKKQSVLTLAWRIHNGKFDITEVKVTIPEGLNSTEIAQIYFEKLPFFNKDKFVKFVIDSNLEGYIFPDTYYISPSMTEEDIIKIMNDNFNEKIKSFNDEIIKFGKSKSDIIKMASILEEEASTFESRQIVADILWKRISIKMALQVDSSFKYINGKTTKDLTSDDLKMDSPYNSYANRGLPPTPISNPGLEAIKAALEPIKTNYLYFLTGSDGKMYYAKTFEEHVSNKAKYLR